LDTKTSRANKRKGTQWEVDLIDYFRSKELISERLRLSGNYDEGDLWFLNRQVYFVVEAKNEKGFKPGPWTQEAVLERDNWKKRRKNNGRVIPLVIAKRRQSNVSKAFVIIQLDEFMELINE
jgi:hypothetical protein